MKIRFLRGPVTNHSMIRKMKSLDPLGWQRFCEQYRNRLRAMCLSHHYPADVAEEISARVVARLYEDFALERDMPWSSFRGHLSTMVHQEMNRFRYESRRFHGFRRGFLWIGAQRGKCDWPVEPKDFADEVAEDLSPRLVLLHDVLDKIRSNVSTETWNTYYRIEILGDSYADLAAETGTSETALRARVYRVKCMIGKVVTDEGNENVEPQ